MSRKGATPGHHQQSWLGAAIHALRPPFPFHQSKWGHSGQTTPVQEMRVPSELSRWINLVCVGWELGRGVWSFHGRIPIFLKSRSLGVLQPGKSWSPSQRVPHVPLLWCQRSCPRCWVSAAGRPRPCSLTATRGSWDPRVLVWPLLPEPDLCWLPASLGALLSVEDARPHVLELLLRLHPHPDPWHISSATSPLVQGIHTHSFSSCLSKIPGLRLAWAQSLPRCFCPWSCPQRDSWGWLLPSIQNSHKISPHPDPLCHAGPRTPAPLPGSASSWTRTVATSPLCTWDTAGLRWAVCVSVNTLWSTNTYFEKRESEINGSVVFFIWLSYWNDNSLDQLGFMNYVIEINFICFFWLFKMCLLWNAKLHAWLSLGLLMLATGSGVQGPPLGCSRAQPWGLAASLASPASVSPSAQH